MVTNNYMIESALAFLDISSAIKISPKLLSLVLGLFLQKGQKQPRSLTNHHMNGL